MDRRLGRLVKEDPRDREYPVRMLFPRRKTKLTKRVWDDSVWSGDQGQTPECVGYGTVHFLEAGPVLQNPPHPCLNPHRLYQEAQKVDGFPLPHDGTTVRAAMKVLKGQGYASAYHWATTLSQTIDTLLNLGPMVVGTNWYEGMFYPTKTGLLNLTGELAGGHCYLVMGVDTVKERFQIKNSWGMSWGLKGHAYIRFKDFARLLKEQGEAAITTEVVKKSTAA